MHGAQPNRRDEGVTLALTGPVVLAVLFGALLHASWNAIIKSGQDKQLDTALIHGLGIVFAAPLVLWVGLPDRAAWPYIAATTVVHLAYYVAEALQGKPLAQKVQEYGFKLGFVMLATLMAFTLINDLAKFL